MIALHNSIFGYIRIIVFQLALWIGIMKFNGDTCYECMADMLAFSYMAVPTRHEVTCWLTG